MIATTTTARAVPSSIERHRTSRRVLVAGAFLLVSLLALQEVTFRSLFPLPEIANFNRANYGPRPSWLRGIPSEIANCRHLHGSKADGAEFFNSLNAYGFRGRRTWPTARESTRERVMFIGDSFVEGLLTDDERTIPERFAAEAKLHGIGIESLNMGIAGIGVPEYLRLIREAVPLFSPETLVIVFYANDFPPTGSIPPNFWHMGPAVERRNDWIPRAAVMVRRALLRKTLATRPPGPIVHVNPRVPDPANPISSPKDRARFAAFVEPALLDQMMKGETAPWSIDYLRNAERQLKTPIDISEILTEIRGYVEQWGVRRLLVAYVPYAVQVSDYYMQYHRRYSNAADIASLRGSEYQIHAAALAHACTNLAIPFVDFSASLREAEAEGIHLYWDFDPHMRPDGYSFIARGLWGHYAKSFLAAGASR